MSADERRVRGLLCLSLQRALLDAALREQYDVSRCPCPERLCVAPLMNIYEGDSAQMPGSRCSNCIAYNFECTYLEAAKVRPFLSTFKLSISLTP